MKGFIDADFSVNDENGNFTGTVRSIYIGKLLMAQSIFLSLNPIVIKYRVSRNSIRLFMQGKSFEIVDGSYFDGSIIFNSYRFTIETGVKLINHLYNDDDWLIKEIDPRLSMHLLEKPIGSEILTGLVNKNLCS